MNTDKEHRVSLRQATLKSGEMRMYPPTDIEGPTDTAQRRRNDQGRSGQAIEEGRILRRRVERGGPKVSYYIYMSTRPKPNLPIFVAIHGIRRRAENQARLFAPMIEALGGTLVAPLFNRRQFSDYQRLGRRGKGERSDMALRRVLAEVGGLTGKPTGHLVMFGYSGGGQFVHRYAMAHPRQIRRMAIAAAGWYTFPDPTRPYPEGTGGTLKALPDLLFDPARFLQIPALVLVGENDTERDAALNRKKRIDRVQGRNRVERGRRWVAAMIDAARRFNYNTAYRFITVAGCSHSFDECMTTGGMGSMVTAYLFEGLDASAGRYHLLRPAASSATDL